MRVPVCVLECVCGCSSDGAVLDSLLEPLEKTVNRKVKTDAVKQEADRNEDMVRSALRAVDALSRIT